MNLNLRKFNCQLIALLILIPVASPALSQDIELTSAQQQILNSLPAAQQKEAMDAMRQLQSQRQTTNAKSINEPLESVNVDSESENFVDSSNALDDIVARAKSRLIINLKPLASLTGAERKELADDKILQKLLGSKLHVLDESGVLSLQGLGLIPLLGLSEEDIERRLAAEHYLRLFEIDANILGQEPIGVEALKPFGYDVFEPRVASLNAPTSGPVPSDYVLGAGDTVRVQFFGNINSIHELEVSRDGVLNLPEIGPIAVSGISFSEFRRDINSRVQSMLIGTQASVSMGQLRRIRIFVLGDAKNPGSYVVNGLSTISSALYQSGGVSEVGSLRDIQLKRNGRVVANFDAYDLLIRGDNSGDQRIQPGDVVFVPPIGRTVSVAGAVRRPAIYEVRRLTTAADLVVLAGGLTPAAFAGGARLERIETNGERTVRAVDLSAAEANLVGVSKGDILHVPEVLPGVENAVILAGHVHRPGEYPWRVGMKLTDLISSPAELKQGVDTEYLLIRRGGKGGEPVVALSASITSALKDRNSAENIALQPGDTINVFSLELGRQRVVGALLDELARQSTVDKPIRKVEISGTVRSPGSYPLEENMRVSDLIRAGGNLSEDAYSLGAELTRYSILPDGSRDSRVVPVDLGAIRRGDIDADLQLREHDYLIVSRAPEWDTIWTVTLEGEVTFPGRYRVSRGETLSGVLQRAGGLTDAAFPEGAVFLRESLKQQEQEQIEKLAKSMESDLASLSLQGGDSRGAETLSTGRVLLEQLRDAEAVGRLVIELRKNGSGVATSLELRDGDALMVPARSQVITVLGETQQNASHLYQPNLSRDDYIDLSGGLTRRADQKLIYVVRANGAVIASNHSAWFGRKQNVDIRPGDTIVVPLDTDRMRPLNFWGSVTQILYQGAIAVAAIKSFN